MYELTDFGWVFPYGKIQDFGERFGGVQSAAPAPMPMPNNNRHAQKNIPNSTDWVGDSVKSRW
ncbi:MAG TPA: hypothetical protein DCQ32_10160 [Cyanobacteria bacterium UBA8156]|nr:hypothetical protein [Cyanobacteria bacterium UBA8156]